MEISDKIAVKATELFLKYGIKSVTMDHIALHLGMAKKTVYRFYESKNALVERFIANEINANKDNCKQLAANYHDPLIKLFLTMMCAQKFYFKLSPSIIDVLEKYYHQAYLMLKRHKDEFLYGTINQNIEEGIAMNLFQNDFNVSSMTWFFVESVLTTLDMNSFSVRFLNSTNKEEIFGHMIAGITTSSGLEKVYWYKSQHKYTSFAETLKQPFWED
jgi:AcrR family transcriptional regulator